MPREAPREFQPDLLIKMAAAYKEACARIEGGDNAYDPRILAEAIIDLSAVRDLDVRQLARSALDRARRLNNARPLTRDRRQTSG